MAGVREADLRKFTQFTGINNRDHEPAAVGNVLREAVNVDVTKLGKVKTRAGYSLPLVPCTLGHSLWADHEGLFPFGLYADDGALHALNADLTTELLRTGLSRGLDCSYARINDAVFWSNDAECGMVDAMGEAVAWACEQPAGQPELAPVEGQLGKGQVQAAITFADARGRESGALLAAAITILPGQGVELSNIPQPGDPVATPQIRVYVTAGDDAALYHAKNLPAGTTSTTVLQPPEGRVLATQFLQPMPPGHIVRYWNGRQLVARGRFVLWSPALRYGLTHIGHMHLGLRKRLTMLEPVEGDGAGVYVSDGSRIMFLAGSDPAQWTPKPVGAYGAVAGSTMHTPASAWGIESKQWVPAWLGTDGQFTVGLPGGNLATFAQGEFVAGVGDKAASLFREADGLMQFITAQRGVQRQRLGVVDEAVARVFREDGTQV